MALDCDEGVVVNLPVLELKSKAASDCRFRVVHSICQNAGVPQIGLTKKFVPSWYPRCKQCRKNPHEIPIEEVDLSLLPST